MLYDFYGETEESRKGVLDLIGKHPDYLLYIFCSHSHGDHYSPIVFELFNEHKGGVTFIFHEEVRPSVPTERIRDVFFLGSGNAGTFGPLSVKAYGSTDIGGSFYVEEWEYYMFHAGDLNNWHWNEEAETHFVRQYEAQWKTELDAIVMDKPRPDLLMFPTDLRLGKDWLKGLKEFLEVIPVRVLAPMHLNGELRAEHKAELQAVCDEHSVELLLPEPFVLRELEER